MRRYEELVKRREERGRLTALLKRDDGYSRTELAAWRRTRTPEQADELLVSVMDDAPGGESRLSGFWIVLRFSILISSVVIAATAFLPGVKVLGILIFGAMYLIGVIISLFERRRGALFSRRAAQELGRRGDDHALSTLIDAWTSGVSSRSPHADVTEEALDSLLMSVTEREDGGRSLARPARTYPALKRLAERALGLDAWRHAPDLSDRQADMVIAVLLLLDRSATAGDRSLLRRVVKMRGTGQNRALLREVACLTLPLP